MNPHRDLFDPSRWESTEIVQAHSEAVRICAQLSEQGHVAYFAGGCVRDAMLGRAPKDFDVATDAVPDRVREIFGRRKTLAFGASFGVIGVLPNQKSDSTTTPTEVATFRSDGDYSDGRRPDEVHFGDAKNDAQRRDFTINGLFYDPREARVIDYVDGEADLANGILRTIGDPERRFDEDKLRMLRAVRFATTLGFSVENATATAVRDHAQELSLVSAERIGAEMRRVIASVRADVGLRLLIDLRLDEIVLPGIAEANLHHLSTRLRHRTGMGFEPSMALVLMAIEEAIGDSNLVTKQTKHWRLSNEESRRISSAMKLWEAIAEGDKLRWSELQPKLTHRDIEVAMSVAEAIVASEGRSRAGIERCGEALSWERDRLDPSPLLTGDTLREAGFKPGPQFRVWLESVRELQLDGELRTTEEAFEWVRKAAKNQ
ncbi:MAG: CCA tRNA nucleotidyltransferase [Planctomycetota bacterium]